MARHSPPQLGLEVVTLLAPLVIIACEGILHHTVLVRSRVPWARARLCTPHPTAHWSWLFTLPVWMFTQWGGIVSIYSYSMGGSQVGYYKRCDSLIGDEEVLRRRWIWWRRQTCVWWPASRDSSFPENVRCTTSKGQDLPLIERSFKRDVLFYSLRSPQCCPAATWAAICFIYCIFYMVAIWFLFVTVLHI